MRSVLIILGLIICSTSVAQTHRERANFRVLFNFDFQQTRVSDRNVRFYGLRLAALKGKNIIGLGVYGLASPQEYPRERILIDNGFDTLDVSLDIDYAMLTYERILFLSDRWQLSLPMSAGLGNVRSRIRQPGVGDFLIFSEREAVIGLVAGKATYSIKFWLFAFAGAGHRFVFTRDRLTDEAYSGFTWTAGLGIRTGALLKYWKAQRKDV